MRLGEYLSTRQESQASFARRASAFHKTGRVAVRSISRIAIGQGNCRADIALAIIRASRAEPAPNGGTVTLEDLVEADDDLAEAA